MFDKKQVRVMIVISYCFAAFVAMLLAKNFANLTSSQIGEQLGIIILAISSPFFIILFNRISANLIDENDEYEEDDDDDNILVTLSDWVFQDDEYDN